DSVGDGQLHQPLDGGSVESAERKCQPTATQIARKGTGKRHPRRSDNWKESLGEFGSVAFEWHAISILKEDDDPTVRFKKRVDVVEDTSDLEQVVKSNPA